MLPAAAKVRPQALPTLGFPASTLGPSGAGRASSGTGRGLEPTSAAISTSSRPNACVGRFASQSARSAACTLRNPMGGTTLSISTGTRTPRRRPSSASSCTQFEFDRGLRPQDDHAARFAQFPPDRFAPCFPDRNRPVPKDRPALPLKRPRKLLPSRSVLAGVTHEYVAHRAFPPVPQSREPLARCRALVSPQVLRLGDRQPLRHYIPVVSAGSR